MPVFNPLVPTGTVPLNIDYQNLQGNFATLNTIYNTDHVPLTDTSKTKGYHNTIHSVPFSTTASNPPNNQPVDSPTSVSGVSEIFTAIINDGINTASALYFQTDTGILQQLTRNFLPVRADNGYTFLPGGIILQWGRVSSAPTTSFTPLLFVTSNINFPNDCFNIWTQPYGSGTPPGGTTGTATVDIRRSTISSTGFEWVFVSPSTQYIGFSWIAIGN